MNVIILIYAFNLDSKIDILFLEIYKIVVLDFKS